MNLKQVVDSLAAICYLNILSLRREKNYMKKSSITDRQHMSEETADMFFFHFFISKISN